MVSVIEWKESIEFFLKILFNMRNRREILTKKLPTLHFILRICYTEKLTAFELVPIARHGEIFVGPACKIA